MQGAKCQHGYLEDDPLWNTKPVKAKQCIGNMFGSPHVEDEPGYTCIYMRLMLFILNLIASSE